MSDIRMFSANELDALFGDEVFTKQVLSECIAISGPQAALRRIIDAYKLPDFFLPSRVKKFTEISRCARECSAQIIIQAPHSHWLADKPIIYHYDQPLNQYIVGPHPLSPSDRYHPVSFFQKNAKIFPYEWADSSITFSDEFWQQQYGNIREVFRSCISNDDPIGIGIDFRFRHAECPEILNSVGSIEYPMQIVDVAESEFSLIVTDDAFSSITIKYRDTLNVGWPCYLDEDLGVSTEALCHLEFLRDKLSELSTLEERIQFLKELEKEMGYSG